MGFHRYWLSISLVLCPFVSPFVVCGDEPSKRVQSHLPKFDGKSLAGWEVINKFEFDRHGKVEVRDGAIRLGEGGPATGIRWKGEPPRVDYEVTLRARRVGGADIFCGLTFPYKNSYCTLIIGGWGGGTVGLSNVDDFAADGNDTTNFIQVKRNQWYQIRLRVGQEKIEGWIDKKKLFEQKTDGHEFKIWWEQQPARPFGIISWNTTAELKELRVRRLDAAKDKP